MPIPKICFLFSFSPINRKEKIAPKGVVNVKIASIIGVSSGGTH